MPWRGMPRRSIRSRLIQLTAGLRSSFVRVLPTINATVCGSRRSWMACPGMARDRSYHVSAHTIGRSSVREGHRQTISSNCAIRGRAVPELTARRPTIVWSASLISRSRAAQAWLLRPAATPYTSKRRADSSQDRRCNARALRRKPGRKYCVPFAGAPGTRSAVLGVMRSCLAQPWAGAARGLIGTNFRLQLHVGVACEVPRAAGAAIIY